MVGVVPLFCILYCVHIILKTENTQTVYSGSPFLMNGATETSQALSVELCIQSPDNVSGHTAVRMPIRLHMLWMGHS